MQVQRDALMDSLDTDTKALEEGAITPEERNVRFRKWKKEEDRLRREVTLLYDDAYAGGCL